MNSKMVHKMNLNELPFNLIKQASKTVELRLNDSKRQLLKIGDDIVFTNLITQEQLLVEITNLCIFKNFKQLYQNYQPRKIGYTEDMRVDYKDMEQYYSIKKQKLNGVVAIEFNFKGVV